MKKIILYIVCSLLPLVSMSQEWPQNPSLKQVRLGGESKQRADRSFDYLRRAASSMADSVESHPADAGHVAEAARVAYALSIEAQALSETPAELDSLMLRLTTHLNEQGYWGKVAGKKLDERQLACNGLLLKALCEYYRYHRSDSVKQQISDMAHNLFASNLKGLKRYTLTPRNSLWAKLKFWNRKGRGWVFSRQRGELLEGISGVVQAYEVLNDSSLVPVVDLLMTCAKEVSPKHPVPIRYQTAALRAQLRWAEVTADHHLAAWVQNRFDQLVQEKLTASYEVAACDSVTSVSATADAFLLANDLWRFSGDTRYLELLQLIYRNALCSMQTSKGDFVPHNIPTAINPFLYAMPQAPVESLAQGVEALANHDRLWTALKGDTIYVNFFATSISGFRGKGPRLSMLQSSTYPSDEKSTSLMMLKAPEEEITWKVFIPQWFKDVKLTVNEQPDTAVIDASGYLTFRKAFEEYGLFIVEFDEISAAKPLLESAGSMVCCRVMAGPLLLGCQTDSTVRLPATVALQRQRPGKWKARGWKPELTEVRHLMQPGALDRNGKRIQVIFTQVPK